ncbi:transcription factor giant [Nomia melanderi]|uniref:transcription factor giant n=1 Tax=Nomia melanderi TaxID=2448451 RepID=UPI0013043621|nr:thyrotroph embryonic factor-like [Nomia melanderi]
MEAHNRLVDNMRALDFSTFVKKTPTEESTELPVLDLSYKKQSPPTSQASSTRTNLTTTSDEQQTTQFSDLERKSPFEGRTFMVTPPYETDSPTKRKLEPIYNYSNVTSNMIEQQAGLSMLPTNLQMSMVSTMPMLYPPNSETISPVSLISSSIASATSTTPGKETTSTEINKKTPRPFKAYPKDPLSLSMNSPELLYDQNSGEAYTEFRKRMLESVKRSNEGSNIKMRRTTKSPGLPTSTVDEKDAAYWERRRKNNEAAKRSRDARRAKEDEIAIRAAFLEQENLKLKYELIALRNETAKLRCLVYST